jgi:hypothetical protein
MGEVYFLRNVQQYEKSSSVFWLFFKKDTFKISQLIS